MKLNLLSHDQKNVMNFTVLAKMLPDYYYVTSHYEKTKLHLK